MRIGVTLGAVLAIWAAAWAGAADLRGHGGPVRALAADGTGQVLTGSFDTSAILWDLESGRALAVLRLHAGGVNAVAILPDGRLVTAGQDGRIGLWRVGRSEPLRVIAVHDGPVSALAVSPDGARLAASGWDGRVALVSLVAAEAEPEVLDAGMAPLGAVAFAGGGLAAAGHDGWVHLWPAEGGAPRSVQLAAPVAALAADARGALWAAATDGHLRRLGRDLSVTADLALSPEPLVSLAAAPGGDALAAGGLGGTVWLVDAARAEAGPQIAVGAAPVWALGFADRGAVLLAGGADAVVRGWRVADGAPLSPSPEAAAQEASLGDSRGAAVFRACSACHSLGEGDGNRAGPSLHGLFGRRIGSAEGYDFSPALKGMDMTWTPETVSALFEAGPNAFTPGTTMPEQRIPSAADRAALIDFLRARTR